MTKETETLLESLDQARHRIPFWWWLTYDALVLVVIVGGTKPSEWAFWLGLVVLLVAIVIDAVEFYVKRPASLAKLAIEPVLDVHPLLLERAALRLADAADSVDKHIMDSGLATRRWMLQDAILEVRAMVDDHRELRRAG